MDRTKRSTHHLVGWRARQGRYLDHFMYFEQGVESCPDCLLHLNPQDIRVKHCPCESDNEHDEAFGSSVRRRYRNRSALCYAGNTTNRSFEVG